MPKESFTVRDRIRRFFLVLALVVLGISALVFVVDYCVFRVRVLTQKNPYGSVVVSHYYAVLQKNGKTQFTFDPPAPENCVNALFPHAGSLPCWYLRRHPEQRTDI